MAIKAAVDSFISDMKSLSFNSPLNDRLSGSSKQADENDTMKTKFLEAWNNFKFEMSTGTSVKKDMPLWLLGTCYHFHLPIESVFDAPENDEKMSKEYDHFQCFLKDFASKPWFTYRKGFPPLEDGGLTSDTGWGCMLRTAQMMMAQCFITHFLGRNWRWFSKDRNTRLEECALHRTIIKWFLDDPSPNCPFSIHRLTEIGLSYRFHPGDWYGPGTVAYIMQDATECAKGSHPLLNQLVVYVSQDCTVYTKDVVDVCHWKTHAQNGATSPPSHKDQTMNGSNGEAADEEETVQRSVIILIPVRLGEAHLNPIYSPCLKGMLALDQCMGIIGGKPRHSLYFVGFQDEHLFYLDPHYCQQADSAATFSNKHLASYHSMHPRKTHVTKLDPSCCLSFYCRDYEDFQRFVSDASKLLAPPRQRTSYPLCLIVEGSAQEHKLRRLSEAESCKVESPERNCGFTEISIDAAGAGSAVKRDPKPGEKTAGNWDPITNVKSAGNGNPKPGEGSAGKRDSKPGEGTAAAPADGLRARMDKLGFASPRAMINKFYRQTSWSPKTSRDADIEEDFEFI